MIIAKLVDLAYISRGFMPDLKTDYKPINTTGGHHTVVEMWANYIIEHTLVKEPSVTHCLPNDRFR